MCSGEREEEEEREKKEKEAIDSWLGVRRKSHEDLLRYSGLIQLRRRRAALEA